ncbi:FG-GAP repeat domain-containing protein [Sulfitobacter sp.]|uniref:FG-GAP repeat domain-containing protein n=1 Tax=Sulfitobacter sp. TaxID=1903071 RepID=UPI003000FE06
MRGVLPAISVFCLALLPAIGNAQAPETPLVSATYAEPTTRYPHGVLGDEIEHGALVLTYEGIAKRIVLRLPEDRVFEDTEPRIFDVYGDGQRDVIVVESHRSQGARLAIYNGDGLVAATPYIGQPNRWLAPVAVADLDGDGFVELAYIDRPHLAKTLRVWRFAEGQLTQIAALEGLTNHRSGERDIAGGLRLCGASPEMVVASADWQRLKAVTFNGTALTARDIGPHQDRNSFANALACE